MTSLLVIAVIQENYSPVFVASQEGHTQVVELLIGAGANVHLATSEVLWVKILCLFCKVSFFQLT